MGTNKIINIVKPYIIDIADIRWRGYIDEYDEIMWTLYSTYKVINCVYIGKEINA